jgi:hypothetical protein
MIDVIDHRLRKISLASKALMKEVSGERLNSAERSHITDVAKHVDTRLIPLHNPRTAKARAYLYKLASEGWDRKAPNKQEEQ